MAEQFTSRTFAVWIACGITALVMLATLGNGAAQAQELPPRPTAIPTDEPETRATPVPDGRITGTVIDQTSGAPVAGIAVRVGDVVVTSDANGNYDRNGLAAGNYPVALELAAGQGQAVQGSLTVQLVQHATVIQHLAFRSPVAPPAPVPTAMIPVALPATGSTGAASETASPLAMLALALIAGGGTILWRVRATWRV